MSTDVRRDAGQRGNRTVIPRARAPIAALAIALACPVFPDRALSQTEVPASSPPAQPAQAPPPAEPPAAADKPAPARRVKAKRAGRKKPRRRAKRPGRKPMGAAGRARPAAPGATAKPGPTTAAGASGVGAKPASAAGAAVSGVGASPASAAGNAAGAGATSAGRSASGAGAASAAVAASAGLPAWLQAGAPKAWKSDAVLARSVGTALRQSKAFGGLAVRAGAVAHVQRGVGAFYISWLESNEVAAAPAGVARGALDHMRDGRLVASPEASSTEELRYQERVTGGVAEFELAWRHLSNETLNVARGLVWVTADGKPRLATAECVVSTTGGAMPPAVESACRAALGSLALIAPAAQRGALAALPPSQLGAGGERLAVGGQQPGQTPPSVGPAPPGAGDKVLYRGPAPEQEERSTGLWIVLFGGALILIALLVNQRSRSRQAMAEAEADSATDAAPAAGVEADIEAETDAAEPAPTASESAAADQAETADPEREKSS